MTVDRTILMSDFYLKPERPIAARWLTGMLRFIRRKPLGAFGALVLILVIAVGVFSPWLAGDPSTSHLSDQLTSPNSTYWFGTDNNGRDLYSRIVFGCQITAMVGTR